MQQFIFSMVTASCMHINHINLLFVGVISVRILEAHWANIGQMYTVCWTRYIEEEFQCNVDKLSHSNSSQSVH